MEKTNKHLGIWGENLAKLHLIALGYDIKALNWRFGHAEADIIAYDTAAKALVFVEVKTRRNAAFGAPDEAVSNRKQQLLYDLAGEYMHQQKYEQEIRFDIIAIVGTTEQNAQLQHYKDAFFPTW
jgi:putative endonuclease